VRTVLVLWDIDYTLIIAGGVGTQLYGAVFADMFGRELPAVAPMAGRTERAIIRDTLAGAGVDRPERHVAAFLAAMAERAPGLATMVAERGRALPGAAAVLAALARYAPRRRCRAAAAPAGPASAAALGADGCSAPGPVTVVQSLLTGNARPLAEVKLAPFGLARYLDLEIGAYGDHHEVRAELVYQARRNAARGYGLSFPGTAAVLVGDTPLDVAAAHAAGARAVGVATGASTVADLAAAGAHAVLPDLSDTAAALTAILGGTQ
jgi:phosphoglycolate phosphatase